MSFVTYSLFIFSPCWATARRCNTLNHIGKVLVKLEISLGFGDLGRCGRVFLYTAYIDFISLLIFNDRTSKVHFCHASSKSFSLFTSSSLIKPQDAFKTVLQKLCRGSVSRPSRKLRVFIYLLIASRVVFCQAIQNRNV